MKTICEFENRNGDIRSIIQVDDKTYHMKGRSHYMRGGDNFVDFEGGPFVSTGHAYPEWGIDKIVKSVKTIPSGQVGWGRIEIVTE